MNRITYIILLVLASILLIESAISQPRSNIDTLIWYGTPEYINKIKKFPITDSDAYQIIWSKASNHPDRYVYKKPYFIIDEYYFFSGLQKAWPLPLQGFYVNAITGDVVFRKSTININGEQTRLPKNAFTEIRKF